VKIWHCFYCRNAWHRTRIGRYIEKSSLHAIEQSAEAYGERLRGPGNVIHIEELPALRLTGQHHSLVITQIETDTPLQGYSCFRSSRKNGESAQRNLFTFGASFALLAQSFDFASIYWRTSPDWNHHVLISHLSNEVPLPTLSTAERLLAWKSSSRGSEYFLEWEPIPHSVRKTSVLRLARNARFRAHPPAAVTPGRQGRKADLRCVTFN